MLRVETPREDFSLKEDMDVQFDLTHNNTLNTHGAQRHHPSEPIHELQEELHSSIYFEMFQEVRWAFRFSFLLMDVMSL